MSAREITPPTERLAVVILNWNGLEFLRQFLPGVIRHSALSDCEVRVVVADNGSTDGSAGYLRTTHPEVQLIELDQNYGFTGGYNRAFEALMADPATAPDYFLLLNSDIEVTPDWLGPLVAAIREPGVAGVMPKLRSYRDRDRFEYAGACGGFIDLLGYPFCRGRMISNVEVDRGQYDTARDVFWTTGAAMLVRSLVYRDLGGLDDHFFAHMEEIDLCWRMQRAGWRLRVEPASVVYHVGGGTLPAWSPWKTYLNFRNNLSMLYKNLRTRQFAAVYFVRFGTDLVRVVSYAVQWKWKFVGAICRGHRDFWLVRRKLERHKEYGFIRLDGRHGVYRGCIVLRYLFGKHEFGQML